MAEFLRSVPSLLSECKDVKTDLRNLEEIAMILAHPLSLMFRAGKNFLINGVDIMKKFSLGWQSYKQTDFFDFGMYLGEAFDEVVLKSPAKKKLRDE